MSARSLRLGVVGLGDAAAAHIHGSAALDTVTIVAGADPSLAARTRFAGRDMQMFESAAEMIASVPLDAIVICSAVATHEVIAIEAAAAGLHILCEKPMALSVRSARLMARACHQAGVKFFYGSSCRYLPAIQRAREIVGEGGIGELLMLREEIVGGAGAEAYAPMSAAHYPPGGPGGGGWGLVDHGVHMLDLFPWMAGEPIEAICGRGQISGREPRSEYAVMTMRGGRTTGHLMYLESSYFTDLPQHGTFLNGRGWGSDGAAPAGDWDPHPAAIHLYGSRGALLVRHYAGELYRSDGNGIVRLPVDGTPPPVQFTRQMAAFAACVRNDTAPATTAADGIRALTVLEAIYRSAESGTVEAIRSGDDQ